MNHFFDCPRCGTKTFERLTTYSHCIECLYFEDHFYDLGFAYTDAWEAEVYLAKHHNTAPPIKKLNSKTNTSPGYKKPTIKY